MRDLMDRLLGRKGGGDELGSVMRNLGHVLSSRVGYGSTVLRMGLDSHDGRTGSQGLRESLTAEILGEIGRYEPRLRAPALRVLGRDGDLWLRFELRGLVAGRPCRLYLDFHTIHHDVRVLEAEEAP